MVPRTGVTTGIRRIEPRKLWAPATRVSGTVWDLGKVVVVVVVVVARVLDEDDSLEPVPALPHAVAKSATNSIAIGDVQRRQVRLIGMVGLLIAMQRGQSEGLSELIDQRAPIRILQNVVECLDEVVDFFLSTDQGWQELDDIHRVTSHLGQYPVALEERANDELREESFVRGFDETELRPSASALRGSEDQSDHESLTSDGVENLMLFH
jgi:hypothetical protein